MTNAGPAALFSLLPRRGTELVATHGLAQRWLMPMSIWHAPAGFDSRNRPDNRPYNAIAWRIDGGLVSRVLAGGQVVEELSPRGFSVHPSAQDLRFTAPAPLRFAHFYFSDDDLSAASEALAAPASKRPSLRRDRVMFEDAEMSLLLDVYKRRACARFEPPTRLEMDSRAQLILLRLLGRHSCATPTGRARGALPAHLVRRACELLAADLATDTGLCAVTAELGVSTPHFCRAFKAATGLSPHEWRIEQRITRAAIMLRTTDMPIAAVAVAVGYPDPCQLARVFRSRRGMTPSAYRKEQEVSAISLKPAVHPSRRDPCQSSWLQHPMRET